MAKMKLGPAPWLYAMPTVLIGATIEGKPNYMPAAFVGIVNFKPPMIACGLNPKHYTCKGIETNRNFSVNIPSVDMLLPTDFCGLHSGQQADKSSIFTSFFGVTKTAPMISECPVTMECVLKQAIPLGVDTLYLAEIVEIYAEDNVLTGGQPDPEKIKPMLFTMPNNGYYALGSKIGVGWSSGKGFKPISK